jgi:hypothetical protein
VSVTGRRIVATVLARLLALGAAVTLAVTPAVSAAATPSRGSEVSAVGTPVSFALLVPLTVRPTATGLIDSATLAADTAPLGVLTRQLDAIIDTPAVIGIDPMIIASIKVLGNAAPASALAWLQRLSTATNEVFALAYADADLASLARVDALQLRDPTGFDFAIDKSHFGPAVTASPTSNAGVSTPSPSPSPTPLDSGATPALPTSTNDVLDWAYTLKNIAWPAEDTVVGADLAKFSGAGYKQVVLSSTNLSSTDSGLVDLSGIQGIVSDAGITSLVRSAVYAVGAGTLQDAVTRLNSALAGMEAVSPGRTVVATLDRRWPTAGLNVAALYADLQTQTSVNTVGLSEVLEGDHPAAQVTDEAGDASRVGELRSVLDALTQESSFATVANTPALVTEPRRLQLLSLLAVAWLRPESGLTTATENWSTQADAFLAESATLRSSVRIVTGSSLFVGAGHTNIPVTVSNASTVPVTVYVNVVSPSSALQVQKQNVALTVEPGSSNKAAIPVQALTNRKVVTTVTLSSVTGVAIGSPDYVNVDLQPGWEGIGTTIVIVLLVLIFGGGIIRNILKRRRERRTVAETPLGE